jgi:NAD-dependent deacetylase
VTPNPGHLALARMEREYASFTVITQNVDGLHARAGSRHLIELHGNVWRDRCTADPAHAVDRDRRDASPTELPRCHCGALLRPDVVWFGESLDPGDLETAVAAARAAQLVLVVGTSSLVYPAAGLPAIASRNGAVIVEINPDETPLSAEADIVLRGPSGSVLPELERLAS